MKGARPHKFAERQIEQRSRNLAVPGDQLGKQQEDEMKTQNRSEIIGPAATSMSYDLPCVELGYRHEPTAKTHRNWSRVAREIGFSPEEITELERLYKKPLKES